MPRPSRPVEETTNFVDFETPERSKRSVNVLSQRITDMFKDSKEFLYGDLDPKPLLPKTSNDYWNDFSSYDTFITSLGIIDKDVQYIYETQFGYAILYTDGTCNTWGCYIPDNSLLNNISNIYTTNYDFAVLKNDGSVISWDRKKLHSKIDDIIYIIANTYLFAFIKKDGSAIVWSSSHTADYFLYILPMLKRNLKEWLSTSHSEVVKIYPEYINNYNINYSCDSFTFVKRDGSYNTFGLNRLVVF